MRPIRPGPSAVMKRGAGAVGEQRRGLAVVAVGDARAAGRRRSPARCATRPDSTWAAPSESAVMKPVQAAPTSQAAAPRAPSSPATSGAALGSSSSWREASRRARARRRRRRRRRPRARVRPASAASAVSEPPCGGLSALADPGPLDDPLRGDADAGGDLRRWAPGAAGAPPRRRRCRRRRLPRRRALGASVRSARLPCGHLVPGASGTKFRWRKASTVARSEATNDARPQATRIGGVLERRDAGAADDRGVRAGGEDRAHVGGAS